MRGSTIASEVPPLVPPRFLVRVTRSLQVRQGRPAVRPRRTARGPFRLACRLDNFAAADGATNFADVRMAWNEFGIALQATITGKDQPPQGDIDRPRHSDGVTLWSRHAS